MVLVNGHFIFKKAMPEVITAKSTASRVENIITESNSAIIIVSAYFKLGENDI